MFLFPLGQLLAARRQQAAGSIRGLVSDKDFDAPLPAAQVQIVETGAKTVTSDQGTYVFPDVAEGTYTLIFSKQGYVRVVRANVIVRGGELTDIDAGLAGDFTEMEEFVVQDVLRLGAGTEAALLELRFDSPSFLDSISADLMSRAGAGDAASALRLVSGATVQDGKFAVIRGLPDRYVSSQLNGVRLPSADEETRAVELDQFPSAVIESIQVSKTFTPDQQGDASGGAVDVRLRGIPEESLFQLKAQFSTNSQVTGRGDFLTYEGGGFDFLGGQDNRVIQTENLGGNWDGAVGVSRDDAPIDSKWSAAIGGKHVFDNDVKIGGFASLFYERDSSFFDNGVNDRYWVENPGDPLTPDIVGGVKDGVFRTSLFDITQGTQSVQWGGLGAVGLETDNNYLGLTYLFTRSAEDKATLAEDTRGKEYYFPGYDPNDPMGPGNTSTEVGSAPYQRTETLDFRKREADSLQFTGRHTLPVEKLYESESFTFDAPELDWTLSANTASLDQPDKRQFGSVWIPASFNPGFPPFLPPFVSDPVFVPLAPAENINLGNLQRIFKEIEETSEQVSVNLKFPFQQWSEQPGYVKFGLFDDRVDRKFDQDSFSNFGDSSASFPGDFSDFWSEFFPLEDHPITASDFDVDYRGDQEISAWYGMLDLPLSSNVNLIGGARFESTNIGIKNDPESLALWFPPNSPTTAPVALTPGVADVDFSQDDVLPSIGLVYEATEKLTLRAAYSQTVARQTFKELTPIIQQEFLGGPVFIGNPDLQMSALDNYDLRLDYIPYQGGLASVSWFRKDIDDPIEFVQRPLDFTFTTPVNYPKGKLTGFELEVRQDLGNWWEDARGLSLGANATFIDGEVTLPDTEIAQFEALQVPFTRRDITNAPEYLYNLYLTYDIEETGSQVTLYYTVVGDTLVAGAGSADGNFVPNIYAKEYGTLNIGFSQRIGENWRLQIQAKNLTNPEIERVYRSDFTGDDVTQSSFTRGFEFSFGIGFSI